MAALKPILETSSLKTSDVRGAEYKTLTNLTQQNITNH
jgi:hypothetical protein